MEREGGIGQVGEHHPVEREAEEEVGEHLRIERDGWRVGQAGRVREHVRVERKDDAGQLVGDLLRLEPDVVIDVWLER